MTEFIGALFDISIHALLAESDIDLRNIIRTRLVFLSTLSLRRATQVHRYRLKNHHYFYPRSPCGERLTVFSIFQVVIIFLSTLSLRRATRETVPRGRHVIFLSTLSLRRATSRRSRRQRRQNISIHALLAESDQSRGVSRQTAQKFLSTLSLRRATLLSLPFRAVRIDFYPRSPCGERQGTIQICCSVS